MNVWHFWSACRTFGELYHRASVLAVHLRSRSGCIERDLAGTRALLCFPPGPDFFVALWACFSLSLIAVPVTPVDPFTPKNDTCDKLLGIVASCAPSVFLSHSDYIAALQASLSYHSTMQQSRSSSSRANSGVDLLRKLSIFDWICTDQLDYRGLHQRFAAPAIARQGCFPQYQPVQQEDPIAFLQYSSGSTGAPKGVAVSHSNVCRNVLSCAALTGGTVSFEVYLGSIAVSWLPMYHDMGLIGFHLTPMLGGSPCVYLSPLSFLANPLLWLRTLHEWTRSTADKPYSHALTGAPPFALDLVVRTLRDPAHKDLQIDLSTVFTLIVGAEPIQRRTLDSFIDATAPRFGFRASCLMPAYGLAENVLHVRGKRSNRHPPQYLRVSQTALQEGLVLPLPSPTQARSFAAGENEEANADVEKHGHEVDNDPDARWLVSCGEACSDTKTDSRCGNCEQLLISNVYSGVVLIVDPITCEEVRNSPVQGESVRLGEIWVAGGCVARGYWNDSSASQSTFRARLRFPSGATSCPYSSLYFLRTGDLGAVVNNELYVTGRIKEVFIVSGKKYSPVDIEECIRLSTCSSSIKSLPALHVRPGAIMAMESRNAVTGKGELICLVEVSLSRHESSSSSASASPLSDSSALSPGKKTAVGGAAQTFLSDLISAARPWTLRIAQRLFVSSRRLPVSLRTLLLNCTARVGARVHNLLQGSLNSDSNSNSKHPSSSSHCSQRLTSELEELSSCICRVVLQHFGVVVAEVVLLSSHSILKTSSGKLRRLATIQALEQGTLDTSILHRLKQTRHEQHHQQLQSVSQGAAPPGGALAPLSRILAKDEQRASASAISASFHDDKSFISASTVAAAPARFATSSSVATAAISGFTNEALLPSAAACAAAVSSVDQPLGAAPHPLHTYTLDEIRADVALMVGTELHLDPETLLELTKGMRLTPEQLAAQLHRNGDEGGMASTCAGADVTLPSLPSSGTDDAIAVQPKSLAAIGLDSVSAMRLTGQLNEHFHLPVPLSPFMLFEDPSFEGVCKLIHCLQSMPSPSLSATREMNALPVSSSSSPTINTSLPYILGIGCAVPGIGSPQSSIMEVMVHQMGFHNDGAKERMFTKIGQGAGIDRRYSVLPSAESIYFGRTGLGNNEPIETRQEIFKREAPLLSLEAARRCLKSWGGCADDITHVIGVTCTGVLVPGLEFHILQGLGLRRNTQRMAVTFMGCFGALSGMKAARAFAAESPRHRVLLVCTELCSLHMQLDDRADNLVGSALFSDGSAAMLVGQSLRGREHPLFEMHGNGSVIIDDTLDMMKWELTSSGMVIGLGKDIPLHIYKHIEQFCRELLHRSQADGVPYEQCLWALHPGSAAAERRQRVHACCCIACRGRYELFLARVLHVSHFFSFPFICCPVVDVLVHFVICQRSTDPARPR
jgi:predicted naringenin-chalcone synthase/acyl-CoA synthetase (AMP-forming)/AMP-acid ligase II